MKYASIGTVSHGTMRTADLADSFAEELAYHLARNAKTRALRGRRRALRQLLTVGRKVAAAESELDEAMEVVEELMEALDTFAPFYCYFGAHEGDGSDYGFWPCMDLIEELPRIADSDPDMARELGEDCLYVNDHGNCTVYSADGSTLLEIV
jgi:hypothetical protein